MALMVTMPAVPVELSSLESFSHAPHHLSTEQAMRGKGQLLSIVKMREVRQCCDWVSKAEMGLTLRNSSPPAPFLPHPSLPSFLPATLNPF